jgi:hypothetical protein
MPKKWRRYIPVNSFTATLRYEVIDKQVVLTILGDFEGVRLVDHWLKSRVAGLQETGRHEHIGNIGVIEYEDQTGESF